MSSQKINGVDFPDWLTILGGSLPVKEHIYRKLVEFAGSVVAQEQTEIKGVAVNVSATNSNGSSAADPTLKGGKLVGILPAGNQDQFIKNAVLNIDGSVTLTLAAAATAQNQFIVNVQKPTA